ncbi:MAG: AAA family ATPase [Fibrobacter sp.]|nr:AAA family ATPase [Fibrobacter sp.]
MNAYEIAQLLKKLGVRETKAETYPNTYSLVNSDSFLAQQVSNRDSASWKKAEYIILTDMQVSQGILNGWRKLTERDPLPSAIQKLCVPTSENQFKVYDSKGELIDTNSLEKIIKHTPDIVDFLNDKNPLTSVKSNQNSNSFTPTQIIYYGVPGCGKSYEVNKVINAELDKYGITDKEYHKVRCVFHPEYCNADFVGQIYPYVKPDNGGVEYRFKPGPFAEIVRRAYRNPTEPFFLIIEEINRGNAAAIFGEMFQLLDRIRPEDGPEELSGNIYNTGWSSYGVTNIDVNAYVRQKSTDNPEKIEYDDCVPYGDEIKFINNTAVRLPPNLSIYATMNTNDQNVFTMDNAFQRRFKSKMIRNVLDENSAQYKTEIDDTGVCWGNFREWINEKILLPQTAVLKADDKCLGGWFITGEKVGDVDKIKKEDFAEKVLKYLWDDVFKRNKSGEIFIKDDKINSLSDLIEAFETAVGFESFEKIFKLNDVDKAKLQK